MVKGVFKIPQNPAIFKGAECTLYEKRVDVVTTEKSVDIVDFIVNQLFLQPKDMVVMKMDTEGEEWNVLKHMEKHNVFPLIDELMIEVHYHHHLRQDVGVSVHPWP